MRRKRLLLALLVVVILSIVVGLPTANASCMGTYYACLKEAAQHRDDCVTGNWWRDAQCGLVQTVWQLSCGAEFARCMGIGR